MPGDKASSNQTDAQVVSLGDAAVPALERLLPGRSVFLGEDRVSMLPGRAAQLLAFIETAEARAALARVARHRLLQRIHRGRAPRDDWVGG